MFAGISRVVPSVCAPESVSYHALPGTAPISSYANQMVVPDWLQQTITPSEEHQYPPPPVQVYASPPGGFGAPTPQESIEFFTTIQQQSLALPPHLMQQHQQLLPPSVSPDQIVGEFSTAGISPCASPTSPSAPVEGSAGGGGTYFDGLAEVDPRFSEEEAREDYRKAAFNRNYDKLYPYQKEVFNRAHQRSSIVYLPTGAGKTVVASAMASLVIARDPTKKVVFIVNRIPLISQQALVLQAACLRVAQLCGDRKDVRTWQDFRQNYDAIVIMDSLFIDMITQESKAILDQCGLIIFDEVHHVRKMSNYAKIFDMLPLLDPPQVLGLSASPGARENREKTKKALEELVCKTRCRLVSVIRETDNLRTTVSIPVSELTMFRSTRAEQNMEVVLHDAIANAEGTIIRLQREHPDAHAALKVCMGMPHGSPGYINSARDAKAAAVQAGDSDWAIAADVLSALNQALILLEESSLLATFKFLFRNAAFVHCTDRQPPDVTSRRSRTLFAAHLRPPLLAVKLFIIKSWKMCAIPQIGAKMTVLFHVLQSVMNSIGDIDQFRGIVFCETKAATCEIKSRLEGTALSQLLKPEIFVGHGRSLVDDGGICKSVAMTDAVQQRTLRDFRQGVHRLLIATSVAEEGLDIPSCNLVIRYEGQFSVQSFIQSRGRARCANSRFIVISKQRDGSQFLPVLNDVKIQDEVITMMCLSNQDYIIDNQRGAKSKLLFEVEPMKFIQQYEHRFKKTVEYDMEKAKSGIRVTCHTTTPNGERLYGIAVGTESRARHDALISLARQLHVKGLIDPEQVGVAANSRSDRTFEYHTNRQVAVTRKTEVADGVAYVTAYDESHWNAAVKPYTLLERKLRERRLPPPETSLSTRTAVESTSNSGAEGGTAYGSEVTLSKVVIHFAIRGSSSPDLMWYGSSHESTSWDLALQTAALNALRFLGENVVLRDHIALKLASNVS